MMIALVALGVLWGGWLGRREAAHVGVGIGGYGLVAGAVIGGAIGYGVSFLPWWLALIVVTHLGAASRYVVERW